MTDQFVAEIRIFPFTFAPTGWATCDGQLLPTQQNSALFSLLGTMYGGNGTSNFALPDLQDRIPVGAGSGNGLTPRLEGESDGTELYTLLVSEIPQHVHSLNASTAATDEEGQKSPQGAAPGVTMNTARLYGPLNSDAQLKTLEPSALAPTGADLPHNNAMRSLTLRFCIALQGVFPVRP
jgi:microcystin-dependent protein